MSDDIWPIVHHERAALAADLASLTEPQWTTPSLCAGWTVRDVLGLRLDATDSTFGTGEGPSVRGPVLALLMAMTGRGVFCEDLEGDGVETLRSRC